MFIAQQLKNENICEYLLYMWQIEDVIRAFHLDMDAINSHIIASYPASEIDRKKMYEWYESLIDMMRRENVEEKGHLQLNKNIIIELNEFHQQLLTSGKDHFYNEKFYSIFPYIIELRKKSTTNVSDIELCFNFLYGIMILRLQKAEITPATQEAQEKISQFMSLLAKDYRLYQEGELKFEE
ncbi:MAG TPA: DUF4924 family protein [Paludibacteraceae bacterium]|nr:DUF4924 family protein [Paludibacteraceae bacterium]HOV84305.1 DUF4924 family protein [Paludibacteraceae bacterium]